MLMQVDWHRYFSSKQRYVPLSADGQIGHDNGNMVQPSNHQFTPTIRPNFLLGLHFMLRRRDARLRSSIRFTAASAITVPGGKIAEAPACVERVEILRRDHAADHDHDVVAAVLGELRS